MQKMIKLLPRHHALGPKVDMLGVNGIAYVHIFCPFNLFPLAQRGRQHSQSHQKKHQRFTHLQAHSFPYLADYSINLLKTQPT